MYLRENMYTNRYIENSTNGYLRDIDTKNQSQLYNLLFINQRDYIESRQFYKK